MSWKQALKKAGHQSEKQFDTLRWRLKRHLGATSPIQILPYHGHGTADRLYLRGRVLEDEGISDAQDDDTFWDNLVAAYKRFESDEIPDARVRIRFHEAERETVTDEEGYFTCEIQPTAPLASTQLWHDIHLELVDHPRDHVEPVNAVGRVLVPRPDSDFGVISDVDDTVMKTHATDLLKMARLTFLHNARTRLPFAGVSAFYQALQAGPDGQSQNPIFYVSKSPWNLYDLLVDFFEIHNIPPGPLFLRDFGWNVGNKRDELAGSQHRGHKLTQIRQILTTHDNLPFVLIGDSGEHDAEIYHQVVQEFPNRIAAIYIRAVTPSKQNDHIHGLIEDLANANVDMLLVANTADAAEHAIAQQLIPADRLDTIRQQSERDQTAPGDLEQLLESL